MTDQTTRPPTVLQVLPRLVAGGVERGTVDVAQALVTAGWGALVVSEGGPMVHQVTRTGAEHIDMPVATKTPWGIKANVAPLVALIRARQVDLVHARSRAPAWSAREAAKQAGVPFVTTYHGTYNEGFPGKRAYNAIMAKGDRVIAISEFIADHVRKRYPDVADRLSVIPRGIDMSIFDPAAVPASRLIALSEAWRLDDGVPVVLLPGRLSRWKGHLLLVEALAELGRSDIRVVMVGDLQDNARYQAEIEGRARKAGIEHVVQIVGATQDMPAAYMLADVVVSASTDPEAFGRVPVEAQAMGRPVVATRHGGAAETVIDGKTGWLCDHTEPRSMARALARALALTADERAAQADLARTHVLERYTVEKMRADTLAVYADLLRERFG